VSERIVFNLLQVLVVLVFSPLVAGVINRLKEIVQSKRGPSIFQPYRDLWKFFQKDEVVSDESSWIFRATPYVAFVTPIFVTMGASRTRMVGFLAEPVFIIVFFTVAFVADSTIPYIVQKRWMSPPSNFLEPSHVLLMAAFIMLILAETGRIPVDNPSGHFELAMIDESKMLEYSGKGAALMKWGGHMKLFVLLCIFLNVLVTPWGLAEKQALGDVLWAVPLVLFKIFIFVLVLVAIESSLAKLRLFRITEFLGSAFITSVAAMLMRLFAL